MIQTLMWEMKLDDNYECEEKVLLAPTIYTQSTNMKPDSGVCGYTYQIVNESDAVEFDFKFLRDGSVGLVVNSALAAGLALLTTQF